MNVCKQAFHIYHVRISQILKCVTMDEIKSIFIICKGLLLKQIRFFWKVRAWLKMHVRMQIIVTIISAYLIKKFVFIPFLFFLRSQKYESNFQQADGLVTRKFLFFCLQQVTLYLKGMPNSVEV